MKINKIVHLGILFACVTVTGCAGSIAPPSFTPAKPKGDALLILPGFGYDRGGEKTFQSLVAKMANEQIDLYVPTYISRSGLVDSRENLQTFVRAHRLDQYERLHVFAFIAGAWAFNPLTETQKLSNLATVIYDRSPLQERAPRIAMERLHFLTWVRYGSPVFDVAKTPYVPLVAPGVKVALLVETEPTPFIKHREQIARGYGSFRFECDTFMQRYDDCMYVSMNHDEIYSRFTELWPELLAFIRTGRFSDRANKLPPADDPFTRSRSR